MINFKLLHGLGYLKLWTPPLLASGNTNLFDGAGQRPFGLHFYVNANLYMSCPSYIEIRDNLIAILHQSINVDRALSVSPYLIKTSLAIPDDYYRNFVSSGNLREFTKSGINCLIPVGDQFALNSEILRWKGLQYPIVGTELYELAAAYASIC